MKSLLVRLRRFVGLQAQTHDSSKATDSDILRRILSNTGRLISAKGIAFFLIIAQEALVAQILGVEQYGVLSIVIVFVTLVNRLTSFRMDEFAIKYLGDSLVSGQKEMTAAYLKFAILAEGLMSVLAFLVIFVLAPFAATWLVKSPETEYLIRFYGIVVLANLISETSTGTLQVFNRFGFLSSITVISRVITIGLVLMAFLSKGGLTQVMLAYLVGNFSTAALLAFFAIRESRNQIGEGWWHTSLKRLQGQWSSIFRFTLSTNFSASLSLITKDSDVLVLGFFRGPTEVGYYKLALTLVSQLVLPIKAMADATYPEIVKLQAKGNWLGLSDLLRSTTRLASLYLIPGAIVVALLSPILISVLYGSDFMPSVPAFIILLIGQTFANIFYWSRSALLALNMADYPLRVNILVSILKIAGVLLLVPAYGYLGAAALLSFLFILGVSLSVRKVYSAIKQKELAFV